MGGWSLNSYLQDRRRARHSRVDGTSSLPGAFSIRRWSLATHSKIGPTSGCRQVRPQNSSTPIVAKRSAPRRSSGRTGAHASSSQPVASKTRLRYMESSALVAALLERDAAVVKKMPSGTQQVTSALTLAEAGRAIIRARATGRLTAEEERAAVRALRTFARRCFILDVDRHVLDRVRRPFPVEPIRTLDAVHLATAERLGEAPPLVTIVTRDDRVRKSAEALGYAVE
jgi:predicted nucleic acid-binding protein